jgi:hypothetical protein
MPKWSRIRHEVNVLKTYEKDNFQACRLQREFYNRLNENGMKEEAHKIILYRLWVAHIYNHSKKIILFFFAVNNLCIRIRKILLVFMVKMGAIQT